MKTMIPSLPHRPLRIFAATAALVLSAAILAAQTPTARIQSQIDSSHLSPIPGSQNALARVATDLGRMPANTPINGITLRFNRSAQQEAALDALIQAQQNPASPLYHKWLTPDQFAAQFGMAQSDIDTVESWLRQQGFTVNDVNRSHTEIHFSGTTGQVETAFATEMHFFEVNGQKHFAPSTALSVPAAIAGVVSDIHNLSDFRPHADHIIPRRTFTSGQTGNVFFAPPDIATTYDIQALYTEGVKGDGQTIAIMGQSAIALSDIEAFQNASNLSVKDPNLVLVPGTGTNTVSSGDESESDLDLEWSGAIAPGANIVFVYVGSSSNYGTFDATAYAIDEGIGNIVSMSYSVCELDPGVPGSYFTSQEAMYKQAAAQGQTVLAASGDQGSTSCYGDTDITSTATQESLAVNYPASSAYVTAVGGTEITAADGVDPTTGNPGADFSTYWNSNYNSSNPSSSNDLVSSVKQYIPEVAWNDDSLNSSFGGCSAANPCLSSSGGGASTLVAQPSFQSTYFTATGETNPSSGHRLVPDVAFYASPSLPGYLYCTSDTSAWNTSGSTPQQASCNSGFRDSSTEDVTVAGGTSFGTPIFAGMVALLNQNGKYTTGAGEINATLYSLAANKTTYAAAFHDVTSGNNDCDVTVNCSGTEGFPAGTGYDEVTGLGSVNLAKLAASGVWPPSTSTLIGTNVSVSPANAAPDVNKNDVFTITVTDDSGNPVTSGSVTLQVDVGICTSNNGGDTTCGGTTVSNQTLTNGTLAYTASFATAGAHSITAQYSGNSTYAASTGVGSVNIAVVSSGKGSIKAVPTPSTLTVAQGNSGTETVTVTPSGGYTGTVNVNIDFGSQDSALSNLCAGFSQADVGGLGVVQIAGNRPGSVTLTLYTDAATSPCNSGGAMQPGAHLLRDLMHNRVAKKTQSAPGRSPLPPAMALAGLVLAGFLGRRSRLFRNLVVVLALAAAGMFISACGSSSSSTSGPSDPPKGTYTGTITATDSTNSSIAAPPTTFTFVID